MTAEADVFKTLAILFGGGGGGVAVLGFVRDWLNKRRSAPSRMDANVLTVGLARDQLAADNERLRAEIRETSERHANERSEWYQERAEKNRAHALDRAEWERREDAMRAEIDELEQKVRALLDEVVSLRSRHSPGGGA